MKVNGMCNGTPFSVEKISPQADSSNRKVGKYVSLF